MHDLIVVYEKGSVEEWSEFIRTICNYQSLKELKVKEGTWASRNCQIGMLQCAISPTT